MIKIRIEEPCSAHLTFKPGDEIQVSEMTPELQTLVSNTRVDGSKVAKVVGARGKDLETRQTTTA